MKTNNQDVKKALELRKIFRKRKPVFSRQDSTKKPKLGDKWRKPKGLQSKMRQRLKHHKRVVKVGYKAPALIRGYHKSGFKEVLVATLQEIEALKQDEGAIIAGSTSIRTKQILIAACQKKNVPVLNINIDSFNKRIQEKQKLKQQKLQEQKEKTETKPASKKKDKPAKQETAAKETAKENSSAEKIGNSESPESAK
jgi:large subunit ribosomal protein L32e